MRYHFCKSTCQNAETGGQIGKHVHNPVNEEWRYSTVLLSVATKKFKYTVHTHGETMEVGWTTGGSVNE